MDLEGRPQDEIGKILNHSVGIVIIYLNIGILQYKTKLYHIANTKIAHRYLPISWNVV
jgi:hypothetical protein